LMVVLCLRLSNPVLRRIELSELPPEVMEALRELVTLSLAGCWLEVS
jgi:hypothetical protein